jgi:hypothetical protein
MDETQMEIVREGELAKVLLESEAFVTTVAGLKQIWMEQLLTSAPEAQAQREEMYRLYLAIQSIEGVIASRVDAMDAVHAQLEEQTEE